MAPDIRARLKRWKKAVLVTTALALNACGGGGNAPQTPVAEPAQTLGIAERVYDATQRTPEGFLEDASQYPGLSEFRFHVQAQDVGIASPGDVRFEACSDEFSTVFSWSNQASASRGLASTASSNSETDWYFQIDRVLDADPASVVVSRVFKCNALDRSTRDASGGAGVVQRQPATAEDLQFLSEYLWRFSPYNNALHAVISSNGAEDSDVLTHDLVRAEAVVGAGVAGCDRIDVYQWRHSLDVTTGDLSESTTWLQSFDARFVNGQAQLCDD
ncbi:MAG: hypothetical protein AAFN07_07485 [Pseudomonadota bacterium]